MSVPYHPVPYETFNPFRGLLPRLHDMCPDFYPRVSKTMRLDRVWKQGGLKARFWYLRVLLL